VGFCFGNRKENKFLTPKLMCVRKKLIFVM
jgi:hypothetical protein